MQAEMLRIFTCLVFALMAAALALPTDARAQQGAQQGTSELQVAGRALSFVWPTVPDEVRLGIVHDPRSAASLLQAQALAGAMGPGLRTGSKTIVPVLIPIQETARLGEVDAVFLTGGLSAGHMRAFAGAKPDGIACITTTMDYVAAGLCMIGIRTEPDVEIGFSSAAAEASGLRVDAALRLMSRQF